jgi:hypothetical protein
MTVLKRSTLEINKIVASLEMKSFKVNKTQMTLFYFNYKELSTSLWLSDCLLHHKIAGADRVMMISGTEVNNNEET